MICSLNVHVSGTLLSSHSCFRLQIQPYDYDRIAFVLSQLIGVGMATSAKPEQVRQQIQMHLRQSPWLFIGSGVAGLPKTLHSCLPTYWLRENPVCITLCSTAYNWGTHTTYYGNLLLELWKYFLLLCNSAGAIGWSGSAGSFSEAASISPPPLWCTYESHW